MFKRLFNYIGKRTSQALSSDRGWIIDILQKSGIVSQEKALQISTVFACVKVLGETIGSLPLKCYERIPAGGKAEYNDYFLARAIRNPNEFQTQMEYIETMVAHMCLRGNHYSAINYQNGFIKNLIPMAPERMEVEMNDNKLKYLYTDAKGILKPYPAVRIFHPKLLSIDGLIGLSPISYSRNALSLAVEAEDHGIKYYKNGAKTSGFVKHPMLLKESAKKNLETSLNKQATGANKFRIVILEEGMDWVASGISNEDSQYLQTRHFQVEEICRIFRVPAVLVQHPDKTMSYASVEQFFLSFVVHSIRPWLVRIEQKINNELVPPEDQSRIFFEFKVDGLLRGDIKSRYASYAIGRQWGWLSPDDIRDLENMNPLGVKKGGNVYLTPMNMANSSLVDTTGMENINGLIKEDNKQVKEGNK